VWQVAGEFYLPWKFNSAITVCFLIIYFSLTILIPKFMYIHGDDCCFCFIGGDPHHWKGWCEQGDNFDFSSNYDCYDKQCVLEASLILFLFYLEELFSLLRTWILFLFSYIWWIPSSILEQSCSSYIYKNDNIVIIWIWELRFIVSVTDNIRIVYDNARS
jgi:hypothetical protein